jgi:hypothetical protein
MREEECGVSATMVPSVRMTAAVVGVVCPMPRRPSLRAATLRWCPPTLPEQAVFEPRGDDA